MKKLSLIFIAAIGLEHMACGGTIPLYENNGIVNNFPADQIDAYAFVNYGEFSVGSDLPFIFQNTRTFTNYGLMQAQPGFFFETALSEGGIIPAESFVMPAGASVVAFPGFTFGFGQPSYVTVDAEQLDVQGLLSVGEEGLIRLNGQEVDLSFSLLEVRPDVIGSGFGDNGFQTETNFAPSLGLFDLWWGGPTNQDPAIDIVNLIELRTNGDLTVRISDYVATNQGLLTMSLFNPAYEVYTSNPGPTNSITQAAFVVWDTNEIASEIRWTELGSDTEYATASVGFAMGETNIIDGSQYYQTLYLVDSLASSTNWIALTNVTTGNTFRPSTYLVQRQVPIEFLTGSAGNGTLTSNLFYDTDMTSTEVTNGYAAYAAFLQDPAAQSTLLPLDVLSNTAGRVEIDADELDLSEARIRGNSSVTIQAAHLRTSANAVVQAPNVNFDLASTNGILRIQNVVPPPFRTFEGWINAYSALWTNQIQQFETNVVDDTNNPGTMVTNITTNLLEGGYHILAVDAQALTVVSNPVAVHKVTLRSTNVIVDDSMTVYASLILNAENWTQNGDLYWIGGTGDFGATNAPYLRTMTNHGFFFIPDVGTFGGEVPLESVVNRGTINASGQLFNTEYFENSGLIQSGARLEVTMGVGKLDSGESLSGGDATFTAEDLKLHDYSSYTGGRLVLDVTHSLSDTGGGAGNEIIAVRGINLVQKPLLGDLLGTRIETTADARSVTHQFWSADDRGVAVAGFKDNVAVGNLVMSAGQLGALAFHAPEPSGAYGLYVDELDLDGFVLAAFDDDDLGRALHVDPNLTIYFAYSNVSAEELDGQLDGRLQWVPCFAGPNSGVNVLLPSGQTVLRNRSLRESLTIDSDSDGIFNGQDLTPFPDGPECEAAIATEPELAAEIRFTAEPLTNYRVEYTTNLSSGAWAALETVENVGLEPRQVTVRDPIEEGQPQRYYRVSYNP